MPKRKIWQKKIMKWHNKQRGIWIANMCKQKFRARAHGTKAHVAFGFAEGCMIAILGCKQEKQMGFREEGPQAHMGGGRGVSQIQM